ncbi:MAG: glycosyltransferase family 4 protein [Anaerolineales bacterium]
MRVLILHMRYAPDLTGTGPLVTELATDLAARGEDVAVVASVPHYGRSDVPREYRGGLFHERMESGVRVIRTMGWTRGLDSVIGRSADYLLYAALSTAAGLRLPRPDVVLCVAPPITVGLTGWLLRRGAPLVLSTQDIWPDGLISMGRLRSPRMIRVFHAFEGWLYRQCRSISVLSEGMKANLISKGVPAEKVVVIPNWVDLGGWVPAPKANAFRNELGLENRFVILFAGNLGYAAALESVIETAALLRDEPAITFLIVGEGSAKKDLMRMAAEVPLDNVRFVTTQPASRLLDVYGVADLSLVTLRKGMGQVSVPSKAYSIMASRRAMLASVPQDSEIHRLVKEAGCGMWVPSEDAAAMARAIRELRGDVARLEAFGSNGRRWVQTHHARSQSVSKYHQWLAEAAGRPPPPAEQVNAREAAQDR